MARFIISLLNTVLVLSLLVAGCATPTPRVIEKVITQVVKEVVKETVVAVGTPQVVEEVIDMPTPTLTLMSEISKPPIIVLPGILGSELFNRCPGKKDQKIWPVPQKLYSETVDKHLDPLELDRYGKPVDQKCKILVGDLVWSIDPNKIDPEGLDVILKGLKSFLGFISFELVSSDLDIMDFYGGLRDHLEEDLGYVKNKDVFYFPYDWRKSITETAELLTKKINRICEETSQEQVIIIAHSMGGLVARYAIVSNRNNVSAKVAKLITLGTPHLGAVEAYLTINPPKSYPGTVEHLNPGKGAEFAANWPGIYQMLPNPQYFHRNYVCTVDEMIAMRTIFHDGWIHAGDPKRVLLYDEDPAKMFHLIYKDNEHSRLPNSELVDQAVKFWQQIRAWDQLGSVPENVKVYLIASMGLYTEGMVYLGEREKESRVERFDDVWYTNGDETVFVESQVGLADTRNVTKYYLKEVVHSKMPGDKKVHILLDRILADQKLDPNWDWVKTERTQNDEWRPCRP